MGLNMKNANLFRANQEIRISLQIVGIGNDIDMKHTGIQRFLKDVYPIGDNRTKKDLSQF